MGSNFKENWQIQKAKLLCTEHPKWKRAIEVIFYSVFCILPVLGLVAVIYNEGHAKVFASLAIFGLIAQLTVVWYLYYSKSVPTIIRTAIQMSIVTCNVWLTFFIFFLDKCL